jgi:hypothetical protein
MKTSSLEETVNAKSDTGHTVKKEKKIFLIYKEIQRGPGAKS